MLITTKGQYAIYMMMDLAFHREHPVTVKQVADRYNLSGKYLEQVCAKLSRAGVIKAIRGQHGGYYLAHAPKTYTVKTIVEAVEGHKSAVNVDEYQTNENSRVMSAVVSDVGNSLDQAIDEVLEKVTLEDLLKSYNEQIKYSYVI